MSEWIRLRRRRRRSAWCLPVSGRRCSVLLYYSYTSTINKGGTSSSLHRSFNQPCVMCLNRENHVNRSGC
ncbi:hypothetical protein GQ55_5G476400 [Panicum hallii var. hallii]|uniref:Uncharacterized protein n=1 Tax=Panicum hallii var. hallii TaxID=1504633 RepID=A0A2T7DR05_9POAL|nr:hypothetical protein GQ55_5G476400 [Panicum hallii var. hallii]